MSSYTSISRKYESPKVPTRKGHCVRSFSEKRIADFLYRLKTQYNYEKPFRTKEGKIIYPDFYLPQYNLYIEFWGLYEKGKATDYNKTREWKLKRYKELNIKVLELFPNNYGKLEKVLFVRLNSSVRYE